MSSYWLWIYPRIKIDNFSFPSIRIAFGFDFDQKSRTPVYFKNTDQVRISFSFKIEDFIFFVRGLDLDSAQTLNPILSSNFSVHKTGRILSEST